MPRQRCNSPQEWAAVAVAAARRGGGRLRVNRYRQTAKARFFQNAIRHAVALGQLKRDGGKHGAAEYVLTEARNA